MYNNQFNKIDMLYSIVPLKKYDEDLLFSYSDIYMKANYYNSQLNQNTDSIHKKLE